MPLSYVPKNYLCQVAHAFRRDRWITNMINAKEFLHKSTNAVTTKETTQVLTGGNYFYYVVIVDSTLDTNNHSNTGFKRKDLVSQTINKFCFNISRVILASSHTSFSSSLHSYQVLNAHDQDISPIIIFLWPTLLLITKLSPSSVYLQYGIPFSCRNPNGTRGGTG